MFTNPGFTLADQMFWIVELFCKTMAAEACKLRFGSRSVALWNRVRRLDRRFRALYAMWKAGTLPKPRVHAPSPSPLDRAPIAQGAMGSQGEGRGEGGAIAPGVAVVQCPASVLPRTFAWMQKLLPASAAMLGSYLGSVINNHPEIRPFVADAPQVGRILRPLCTMAGIKLPDYLALPKRVRKKDPPSPQAREAKRRRRTPQEIAAAVIERSLRTGKPVDPKRMSAAAYGCVLHWPRDANCPPPEIGYGGRSFPPLPRDYVRPKDED